MPGHLAQAARVAEAHEIDRRTAGEDRLEARLIEPAALPVGGDLLQHPEDSEHVGDALDLVEAQRAGRRLDAATEQLQLLLLAEAPGLADLLEGAEGGPGDMQFEQRPARHGLFWSIRHVTATATLPFGAFEAAISGS